MTQPHPECAKLWCSLDTLKMSWEERFDHMEEMSHFPTCDDCPVNFSWLEFWGMKRKVQLSAARWIWLNLQEVFGRRIAQPMPGDPQPEWWPSFERQKPKPAKVGGTIFERLKSAYRIEYLAGGLTTLRGLGNVLKGRCPLHDEKSGEAFAVYVDEQRWQCFGKCNTGGDVIAFVEACIERKIEWRIAR